VIDRPLPRPAGERGPAWSWEFAPAHRAHLDHVAHLESITPAWAWEDSTGAGVRVAIVDSGVDNTHPMVDGRVRGWASFLRKADGTFDVDTTPHDDSYGHGTACAGIIRQFAPDAELYSLKVLGSTLGGTSEALVEALRWAIEHQMDVVNLSLGSTNPQFIAPLHRLVDEAYFQGMVLVTAANNQPSPSYPSLYATVISVACHEGQDPYEIYYNPRPPVEFGAPGVNVTVAWKDGTMMAVTGNSYAAPHVSGLAARILGKHPNLAPFQIKTILRATSRNVSHRHARRSDGG
jgi:subtilisin family serine protease